MEAKKKNLVKWTQLVVQSNECHCVIFKYIHALDKRSQIINFFLRKKKTLFIYFLLSICSICLSKFMYTMYMQVSMDAREGWIPPELESCACELPHVHAINRTQSSAKALLINFFILIIEPPLQPIINFINRTWVAIHKLHYTSKTSAIKSY